MRVEKYTGSVIDSPALSEVKRELDATPDLVIVSDRCGKLKQAEVNKLVAWLMTNVSDENLSRFIWLTQEELLQELGSASPLKEILWGQWEVYYKIHQ